MKKEEYSQAAFSYAATDSNGIIFTQSGMTLLDYFAAKAMADIMSKGGPNIMYQHIGGISGIAHHSYQIAAAMMEERKKYLQGA